ncbi:MAG: ATP12 family protein [Pseudomonadota bacterium]
MSGWSAKKFWKEAKAEAVEGGYAILLDGRMVRTPAKSPLIIPSRALAQAVTQEWEAQSDEVKPATMPLTRAANSAIDKVGPQRADVVAMLAEYGGTDLICYRAESPVALAARQAAAWDELLDWAEEVFAARLQPVVGVMFKSQDVTALSRLLGAVDAHDDFELTALHDLIALTGSLVLGLAVSSGRLSAEEAWPLSRIDETWQEEQWGVDEEAAEMASHKRADFDAAARLLALVREA